MKPNGRRRWRKWAKRCRKQRCGEASLYSHARTNKTRRHYGRLMTTLWALPPPLFSLRSLVGMSQRRRKYLAWLLWSTTAGAFDFARKHYRVGQRVRPCAGCPRCLTKYEATFVPGRTDRWRLHDKECRESKGTLGYCEDGRWMNGTPCDGSGVIPARSQVNAGKPLAVEPAQNP